MMKKECKMLALKIVIIILHHIPDWRFFPLVSLFKLWLFLPLSQNYHAAISGYRRLGYWPLRCGIKQDNTSLLSEMYISMPFPLHCVLLRPCVKGLDIVGFGDKPEGREGMGKKPYWRGSFILTGSCQRNLIQHWQGAKCNSLTLVDHLHFKKWKNKCITSIFGY